LRRLSAVGCSVRSYGRDARPSARGEGAQPLLEEATSLEPHTDTAWALGLRFQATSELEDFLRLLPRCAQAAKMVQLSEESIVAVCERVLEGIS
jgi:hypothetical protein